MNKNTVFLTGLPYSGISTLSLILKNQQDIHVSNMSPLSGIIRNIRNSWSEDPFLLSQLDHDFENVYRKMKSSLIAFFNEWIEQENKNNKKIVLDKSYNWLGQIDLLKNLNPHFKMIVAIRDLRGIYTDVEYQHRSTILLNFRDSSDPFSVTNRYENLFGGNSILASALHYLNNLSDIPDIIENLYFCRYEDIIGRTDDTICGILDFIESDSSFNLKPFDQLESQQEFDSLNNYKYIESSPAEFPELASWSKISPRILQNIFEKYQWFFERYYSEYYSESDRVSDVFIDKKEIDKKIETDDKEFDSITDGFDLEELERRIAEETDLEP